MLLSGGIPIRRKWINITASAHAESNIKCERVRKSSMDTPVYDFLKQYAESGMVRLHMPGHKGRLPHEVLREISQYDITEIAGADSLFEANGILAQSEENTAALYGSGATCFLAGGSTIGIQTMLACVCSPGDTVIAARNAHKAFINTCALLDLNVRWILPACRDSFGVSGTVEPEQVEAAISEGRAKAVYITSPDYLGYMSDVGAIAAVCKRHGIPLLVDNAHGAHLKFGPEDRHPITLGAAMCCDSAHKTLPVLTGGAYLHIAKDFPVLKETAKEKAALFASTSPSYLILLSLDLCNEYLAERGRVDFAKLAKTAACLRRTAREAGFSVQEGLCDDTKLTIDGADHGLSGGQLAEYFRVEKIECEYAGERHVVFMLSPQNTAEDINRFRTALLHAPYGDTAFGTPDFSLPKCAMTPRTASFAPYERVKIEEACVRIAAQTKIACPPGVPLVVAGERIDKIVLKFLKNSGISFINVVK